MEGIGRIHRSEYSKEPQIIVEVPQATTLFGAFSEHCNGSSVVCTNSQGIRISISRRDDNTVRVSNATKQDRKKFQVTSIKYRTEDRWANTVKAMIQAMIADGCRFPGMDIVLKGPALLSDPPHLAATVFSGIFYALDNLFSLGLDVSDMLRMLPAANSFSSMYSARVKDVIAVFLSRPETIMFFDIGMGRYSFHPYPFNGNLRSLILECSIPVSVFYDEVEAFRRESRDAILKVRKKKPGAVLTEMQEREIRRLTSEFPEKERNYVSYLVQSSSLSKSAESAILGSDSDSFAKAMNTEQKIQAKLAELTGPEIDWIVRRLLDSPSIKSVMQISVGVSGTMLVLAEGDEGVEHIRKQMEEYEHIFGFHPRLREFVPSGSLAVL